MLILLSLKYHIYACNNVNLMEFTSKTKMHKTAFKAKTTVKFRSQIEQQHIITCICNVCIACSNQLS